MNTIKLTEIDCTDNRKMEGIASLAENIEAVGLIQPIVLAKAENGRYRVIAGRRRFRAVEQLKWECLTESQYVICTADPELAAFCENFHRANLTLAEEVEQFNQLKSGHTIQELAAMLGKTPQYVALRLNLTNLSPAWKRVLKNPEKYSQWTPAKLEFIAKQPREIQEEVENWIDSTIGSYSVGEIRRRLEHDYTALKSALFDTADCLNCPKRSGAAELLFPELEEKGDNCLDRSCFELKMIRHILKKIEEIRANLAADPDTEPFYLYCDDQPRYGTEARELFDRIPGVEQIWRIKKSKGKPNAFCVWGTDVGKFCRVSPISNQARPINPKNEDGTPAVDTSGKKVKTLAEREAELIAKRRRLAVENLRNDMQRGNETGFPPPATETILRLLVVYGYNSEFHWSRRKLADSVQQLKREYKTNDALIQVFWKNIQSKICEKLREDVGGTLNKVSSERAETFCKLIGIDWDALYLNKAVEAIPEPKSLLAARKAAEAEK